ncbi:MAG: hypothetical protein ABI474_07155 [Actinomycetota bacterium]
MSLHSVLIALGALLPSAGVAYLFYVVVKAMLEGDRNERLAHSKWEASQVISTPSTEQPNNTDQKDSTA